MHFVFLQESPCSEDGTFWKNQWGKEIWLSHGSNRSAGVAILKDRFNGKVLEKKIHDKGHWIFLVIEVNAQFVLLGNIYGYNSDTINCNLLEECEDINSLSSKYPSAKIILGGDFNMTWSQELDRYPSKPADRENNLIKF